MNFHEIAVKNGTDKGETHLYMHNYEKHLAEWRDKQFLLLEIGVASGASIRMWREIFPKARVFGIDNNPDCAGEGIFIGDQTNPEFLDDVLNVIGTPNLIIEDGAHYGPATILTFEYLFPNLSANGWYIIEDTHCFYDSTYGEAPPFGQGMSRVFNFFSGLTCHVDVQGRGYTGNTELALNLENPNFAPVPEYSPILDSMHIHPSLWFFKRK